MSTFQSTKVIPSETVNLGDVAKAVEDHFRQQGFEVQSVETIGGSWHISIHKGGLFKAALGMKTALNITLETVGNGTLVHAGVGIFGQQVVPTAITWFIFWPVLITQLWGLVKQSKLDDEAVSCVEKALALSSQPSETTAEPAPSSVGTFCTSCGKTIAPSMKFCPACGQLIG